MNQAEFREAFPVTRERIYFNHAAFAPYATPVAEAIQKTLQIRLEGRTDFWMRMVEDMEKLRGNYARLIGCPPERIGIMPNTVAGVNVFASGLDWQEDDEVILYSHEFPANVYPFTRQMKRGVRIRWLEDRRGRLALEDISAAITDRTRAVAISSVQYLTGFRSDLAALTALCHEQNVRVAVDAIQSIGVLATRVVDLEVDFLACGGHKWLLSPLGSGFCYIREELQDLLHPGIEGYMGKVEPEDYDNFLQDWSREARRFELGTPTGLSLIGARAATDLILDAGVEAIEQHVSGLLQHFQAELAKTSFQSVYDFSPGERGGIFMVSHAANHLNPAVYTYLVEHGVSCALRGGMLRFAPHYYNTTEEVDQVVDLLRRFGPGGGTT